MKIQINQNNKYNQNKALAFQGLNRYLSRHIIENKADKGILITAEESVLNALEKCPNSRRFVGNLPPDWINTIPKEKRKETVQQIQDLFADFAKKICSYWKVKSKNYKLAAPEFEKKLEEILNLKVNINYYSQGDLGKTFKLNVGEKLYIFKNFHRDLIIDGEELHGKTFEPAFAPYAHKNGCKTFADFYFGKVAAKKDHDGFILTLFEDYTKELSPHEELKRLLRILKSPITTPDIIINSNKNSFSKNLIGLKIIDLGNSTRVNKNLNNELKTMANEIAKYGFNILKRTNDKPISNKNLEHRKNLFEKLEKMKDILFFYYTDLEQRQIFYNAMQRIIILLEQSAIDIQTKFGIKP